MDLISLYYFQELSKDLNMTKTAERLYISQQTLSNHIQRLEQYYGTKLFYRKPSLSLTCAGEFVLSFAQVVGKEERNLKDILSDVEHQERGTLRFGASMARVIVPLGENWASEVPLIRPLSRTYSTAWAYQLPASTSA